MVSQYRSRSTAVSIKLTHLWLCAQLLQQNLETNFYSGNVSWDEVSPNDAAALLKKFIRELPAPLLTAEYLNTFSAVRGQRAKLHLRHNEAVPEFLWC